MERDAVLAIILQQIRTVVPELENQPMGSGDSMADLGVDSVSRQEVLILSMEALNLDLPMVQLFGPRNIGELAELLHGKLPA